MPRPEDYLSFKVATKYVAPLFVPVVSQRKNDIPLQMVVIAGKVRNSRRNWGDILSTTNI